MPLLSPILQSKPVPDWLSGITLAVPTDLAGMPFPLPDVLRESAYYPACGIHGTPVKYLAGATHSFVYADYGVGLATAREQAEIGFKGYRLIGIAEVLQRQLTPNGWYPRIAALRNPTFLAQFDAVARLGILETPFALWSIFERDEQLTEEHGPPRFSLLFIGGDGIATYDALYRNQLIAPEFLCLIQNSGGNYTNFHDEDDLLACVVVDDARALPRYLVTDHAGAGGASPWPTHYPTANPTQAYRLWSGN